jgi:hypothetical protein
MTEREYEAAFGFDAWTYRPIADDTDGGES